MLPLMIWILTPAAAAALGYGFYIWLAGRLLGPQGLVVRHKQAIIDGVAQTAARHISLDGLADKLADPALLASLTPTIEAHVDHFLKEKLAAELPMISMFVGDKTIGKVKLALMAQIDELLPTLLRNYAGNLSSSLDVEQLITNKLQQADFGQIAAQVKIAAAAPVRQLAMAGALLGAICALLGLLAAALVGV